MEQFNTKDIFNVLIPQWKKLAIVAVVAILVSFLVSSPLIMKPLYKSYAVVYPVNLSPSSEESNTEQLLQWFNSEEIKKALNKKFNLYEHYRIDTTDSKHETYYNLKYKELVSINATLYESIEISVKDESQEMAQKLVQGIIDEANHLIASVKKERLQEYIDNSQKEYIKEIKTVDSIQKIINNLRVENNIIDFGQQAKALTKKIYKGQALNDDEKKTVEALKTKETVINKEATTLASQLGTYNYFRNEVNKYTFEYNSKISFTNVVSKPTYPDSKCYPIRSLVVAIITISSLLVACIYLLITANLKKPQVD